VKEESVIRGERGQTGSKRKGSIFRWNQTQLVRPIGYSNTLDRVGKEQKDHERLFRPFDAAFAYDTLDSRKVQLGTHEPVAEEKQARSDFKLEMAS
jgi:hypothetical protein